MPTSQAPDVLVIGGGAIGVASAYELARVGAKVTLLEKGGNLASGCSYGNAGLIRPSHSAPLSTPTAVRQALGWMWRRDSPFYVRPRVAVVPWLTRFVVACGRRRVLASTEIIRTLTLMGLDLHASYASAGLDTGFQRRGILNLYETEHGFEEGRREAKGHAAAGHRNEVLDRKAIGECIPTVKAGIAGCILYPDDAHCNPAKFVKTVGKAAAELGAEIRTGVEVLEVRREGDRVGIVTTTAGKLTAGEVVLAAGAWSARLARSLGVRISLEPAKGYKVDFAGQATDPRVPFSIKEARVICTPLGTALRFAGTLELTGLDPTINQIRVAAILAAARRNLDGLDDARITEVWSGLRPCSPDGIPIIGRPRGLQNLVLATGHGMTGMQLAPVTGRLVAELLTGPRMSFDVSAVSPDRFGRLWS